MVKYLKLCLVVYLISQISRIEAKNLLDKIRNNKLDRVFKDPPDDFRNLDGFHGLHGSRYSFGEATYDTYSYKGKDDWYDNHYGYNDKHQDEWYYDEDHYYDYNDHYNDYYEFENKHKKQHRHGK